MNSLTKIRDYPTVGKLTIVEFIFKLNLSRVNINYN